MPKNKQTTRELLSDLIAIESELELGLIPDTQENKNRLSVTKKSLEKKMQNIDDFQLELKRREKLLDAEAKVYMEEITSLRNKMKKIASIRMFFDGTLIPAVVKQAGKDGVYETERARYKLYETYGGVEVDENNVLPKYKKMKVENYIDRAEARKDAIAADKKGERIPGISIKKVERIRKT